MKSTIRAASGPPRAAHLAGSTIACARLLRRDLREVEPDQLGRAAADVEDQHLLAPPATPAARRRSPPAAPPPRAGSPRAAARSRAPPAPGSGCRCAPAGRPRSPPAARCRPGSARASRRRSRAPPASGRSRRATDARCAPARSRAAPTWRRRRRRGNARASGRCDQHPAAVRAQVEGRIQIGLRRRRLVAAAPRHQCDTILRRLGQVLRHAKPVRIVRRSPQLGVNVT